MRPRLVPRRLLVLSLAFALGIGGQALLNTSSLWPGLCLYGIALLLLVWGERRTTVVLPANLLERLTKGLRIRHGSARGLGLAGALGVLLFSILAYRAFGEGSTRAWTYYLAGLAYLVAATLLLTRGEGLGHLLPRTRSTRWLLVLVFLLALALRVWRLGSLPAGTWFDEALSGLQGAQWNQDPAFRPQFESNNSGQLVFLYAAALRWFGHSTLSIRLVSAALGLACVLAAYLSGSEIQRDPRFGLAMAAFVAVSRWHVNFSRIAMPGIDTPLFGFLSLFFLTRLLRRGRLRDAVWSGLSLGLGLSMYSAFRLFLLAIGLFAILSLFARRAWRSCLGEGRWWLRLGIRLGAVGLALWLAALPVIHLALNDPSTFWNRVRLTSIVHRRDEPNLAKAIGRTARLHLLMFNWAGDRNGRHNVYGEPILDPVMGVLFVLGLGLAVARLRQPANLFFAILFPVGLLGGILSLDFEAPQSLRSIAAFPAVIYFCALSLAMLGHQIAQHLQRRLSASWLAAPALALGGYVLFFNAHTYFVRQASAFFSWSAFSTAESIVGQRMAELGPEYSFYLSPLFTDHPSIRFLSPETPDRYPLTLPDALPVRQPADRPAALFIHPDDRWVWEKAQRLYPNGEFETVFDPQGQTPVLYVARLTGEDIARVQGLELRYWPGQDWEGQPESVTRVETVDATWPDQLPRSLAQAPIQEDVFAAEWSGVLYVPEYASYRFTLRAPTTATLELDSQAVAMVEEGGQETASLVLAQGNHHLRVRALCGPGRVSLLWQPPGERMEVVPQWVLYAPPVTYHGLQGDYYSNAAWEGTPALSRIDPFLDTYFHVPPLPRPYSAEWSGALEAPASGMYRLGLRAVDWAQLSIDGEVIVETSEPGVDAVQTIALSRGAHNLRLRFKDTVGHSRLHLLWQLPGEEGLVAVPSQYLWPSQAIVVQPATAGSIPPSSEAGGPGNGCP